MRCMVCGREAMNPEANYCDYCGSSFRQYGENTWEAPSVQNNRSAENTKEPQAYTAFGTTEYRDNVYEAEQKAQNGEHENKASTGMFLGVMLLPFVPMIGSIAYLIILFHWAFSAYITDARKNWARATLIYTAIIFVLILIFTMAYLNLSIGGTQ
ncbi:MAG: hypothetical protein J1E35_03030 [Lachnospiraceae bacterium]|nr:hypothetical protein [Lachnospiraceae bacterium]